LTYPDTCPEKHQADFSPPDPKTCDHDEQNLRSRLRSLIESQGKRDTGHSCAESSLRTWFEPLDLHQDGKNLVVSFPHPFFQDWFESRGKDALEKAAAALGLKTRYAHRTGARIPSTGNPRKKASQASPPVHEKEGNMPGFASFITGAKNLFTVNLLMETAQGTVRYNPVLLKGASGTGKTHLLRATADALAVRYGQESATDVFDPFHPAVVLYQTAQSFSALFHTGLAWKYTIRSRLQHLRGLCVDDIHLLEENIQEELIALMDAMTGTDRPVLCSSSQSSQNSSDSQPSFQTLIPPLAARLCMGMVLELTEPDLDVRLRYAQICMGQQGLAPSRDTALLVARRCADLRRLHGVILRMAAFYRHTEQLPDEQGMEHILQAAGSPESLTPETVLTLVASRCGFTPRDLRSRKREPDLVLARQIAMFLCRELLGESFPALGRIFGGKDHSTVIYAVKKIREIQVTNKKVRLLVTELTKSCRRHVF